MAELKTLKVVPYGDVTNTFEWGSYDVTFYNGRVKKNRKRIHPTRALAFNVSGTLKTFEYLRDFYNDHKGCLEPFLFEYDGEILQCRFADKISFKQKRELHNVVGFEASIVLSIDNKKAEYIKPPAIKQFDLPIRGEIEDETDWNTNILDMNVKGRSETWKNPIHKFSFNLSGTKKERDKLIQMVKLYGDFVPIEFPANDTIYKCFLPSSVEITDKREGQNIIGYNASLTLTSTNEIQDIVSLQGEWAFLIGEEQLFLVKKPVAFLMGKFYGDITVSKLFSVIVGQERNDSRIGIDKPYSVILGKEI